MAESSAISVPGIEGTDGIRPGIDSRRSAPPSTPSQPPQAPFDTSRPIRPIRPNGPIRPRLSPSCSAQPPSPDLSHRGPTDHRLRPREGAGFLIARGQAVQVRPPGSIDPKDDPRPGQGRDTVRHDSHHPDPASNLLPGRQVLQMRFRAKSRKARRGATPKETRCVMAYFAALREINSQPFHFGHRSVRPRL